MHTIPARRFLLAFPLAALAIGLAPPPEAAADDINAVYAFAQQKIYGMTINYDQQHAAVVGDPLGFSVKMTNAATSDSLPGLLAKNGGLDAGVAYLASPTFTPPPTTGIATANNFVWNTPNSSAPSEVVLKQVLPTTLYGQGFHTDDLSAEFASYANQGFSRADAYVTVPDRTTNWGTGGNASSPSGIGWPAAGTPVATGKLFAPTGSAGTLSLDSVAEAMLSNADHDTIGSGVSDWVVTGKFKVVSTRPNEKWSDVSLFFNVAERLVVYSHSPLANISTASNNFSFDITSDLTGESVFESGVLGTNPSTTRLLSSPLTGSETYNNWTSGVTNAYPSLTRVEFKASKIGVGNYTFTIKGSSTAYVSAVPEPATNVSLAVAGLAGAAGWLRRRMHAAARA